MYLFIDTETGGVTTDHSLLSVSAIATDKRFNIINVDEHPSGITILIKSPKYVVNAKALSINKIDLILHDQLAVPMAEARLRLLSYLDKALCMTNKRAFVVAGHNVEFDRKFVTAHLLTTDDWEKYMTYPVLDTAVIARFMNAIGLHDRGYSLSHLVSSFSPDYQAGVMHNSHNDTLATIELARQMVNKIENSLYR